MNVFIEAPPPPGRNILPKGKPSERNSNELKFEAFLLASRVEERPCWPIDSPILVTI